MKFFLRVIAAFLAGFLVTLLVLYTSHAHAADTTDWPTADKSMSKADLYRQVAVSGLLIADAVQTLEIYRRGPASGYGENNPLLRDHWSEHGIETYFAATIAGSAAVARALPADYRPAFQYSVIALELACIIHNRRVGLHFSGSFK